MAEPTTVGRLFLGEAAKRLDVMFGRIGHCVGQLTDDQVWWRPHEGMNSVANIILHLCGNLTQWVVAGVQQLPDTRDRPREFAERMRVPKAELLDRLGGVVGEVNKVLAVVTDEQLLEPRRVQGYDETVLSAVYHSLEHFSGHAQEIIYITRLQLGDAYRFAWTPTPAQNGRGASPQP